MLFALMCAAVGVALSPSTGASSVPTSPPWPSWKKASAPFVDSCYGSAFDF